MDTKSIRRCIRGNAAALFLGAALFLLIFAEGVPLYARSQSIMQDLLRQRLMTAASLAAEQFRGEDIDRITGPSSMKTKTFRDTVVKLDRIRTIVPNISFAYIMRKTKDPNALMFIADADALKSGDVLDKNGNGVIEPEEEPSFPGDLYDISDISALQGPAFERPTVDEEITIDQWGELISGYAPVFRANGTVAGTLGIDMNAHEYLALSKRAFSPLLLIAVSLIALSVASLAGYAVWNRKIEAMRMVNNERASLLELVSHQLGAPIVTIKWWAELLKEGSCDSSDACDKIVTAAERMNGIVRALRGAEHVVQSDESMHHESVSTSNIVRDAVRQIAAERPDIGNRIETRLEIDGTVRINPRLIHGVVIELLENAIVYSEPGTPIHIAVSRKGKTVRVSVMDRGCGIPEADKPRIFGRLARAGNARLMKPDGNGIGLFVCKTIVERAGGRMGFESREGQGSVFWFTLPVG